MQIRTGVAGILAVAFVIGAILIVINGRPATQIAQAQTEPTKADGYTMADVAAHATSDDCWSAINGSVYDLSTWVSRHPGGPRAIMMLCGADGSDAFNGQHGDFPAAQSTLVLLKIGSLAL